MSDIYSRQPVNKTASVVTSQSGCASDDTLTNEQLRENLVSKLKHLEDEITSTPKGSKRRRELGAKKAELCAMINGLRPSRKCKGVKDHILDVLREELSAFEFKRILHKASVRAEQDKTNLQ